VAFATFFNEVFEAFNDLREPFFDHFEKIIDVDLIDVRPGYQYHKLVELLLHHCVDLLLQ